MITKAELEQMVKDGVDLRHANLRGADLQGANLWNANLWYADIQRANLTDADLRYADLEGADLRHADLTGADLTGADLTGADLEGADLEGARLPHFQVCPETGAFEAWKKMADGSLLKIMIPAHAKRTSSMVGRKCRASSVIVLEGCGVSPISDKKLVYTKGEEVFADAFDDDIRVECTHGIHFYLTRLEAEES